MNTSSRTGATDAKFIHLTAFVFDLRLQPAEDILRLVLSRRGCAAVAESLDVFHILILVRHMAEKTDRRAAQFKDAVVEPRPQIGWRIFRDDPSILHKSHAMTARGFIHIGRGDDDTDTAIYFA